jgi:hypothetical protein
VQGGFTLKNTDRFLAIKNKLGKSGRTPTTRNEKFNRSRRQEDALAKILDGRRHIGSGAFFFDKSDLSSALYRIEAKRTDTAKLRIEQAWLEKLEEENAADDRITFMAIQIKTGHYGVIKAAHYIELEKEMGSYRPGSFVSVGVVKLRKETQKSFSLDEADLDLLLEDIEGQPLLSVVFNAVNYSIVRIEYLQTLQHRYLAFKEATYGKS